MRKTWSPSYSVPLLLAMVAGAVLGGLAYGYRAPGGALEVAAQRTDQPTDSFVMHVVVGALLGVAVVALLLGRPVQEALSRKARTSLRVLAGLGFGLVAAFVAYGWFWLQVNPGNASDLLDHATHALDDPEDPLGAFMLVGALVGVGVALFAGGEDVGTNVAKGLVGGFLGGLAGLVIYAVAYATVTYREIPVRQEEFLRFGEAVFSGTGTEAFFVAFGAVLGMMLGRYSWRFYGLVTLVSLVMIVTGYLLYSLTVTLPLVDEPYRAFAWALFGAEVGSLALVVMYSFYTIDVSSRKKWVRGPEGAAHSPFLVPKVAFHVCSYNEPFELVRDSLDALRRIDYPKDRYLVMVLDDSTAPESREPLEAYCQERGVQYLHRDHRAGFKAGALNHGLKNTPHDADLVAVLDADYQVEPNYLAETVGYFANPNLGWVQTPQDYRNRHQSYLAEQYYLADGFFYKTVLPSRNEENTIIFCGTMGILRKKALLEAGGWSEKHISEDAELSIRILGKGYDSLYVNTVYGRGLLPATFNGYKKQLSRWAYGGAHLFRTHALRILFGPYSKRQTFDYMVGSLHWFEGIFIFAISLALLALALSDLAGANLVTHHSQEVLLIGLVPIFLLVDGLTRLHLTMRSSMRMTFRQSLRVLGMWLAVKFSNARAASKAMLGFTMPFVRTPKGPDRRVSRREAFRRALRIAPFETTMGLVVLAVMALLGFKVWALGADDRAGLTRAFLLVWLSYYLFVYGAAPVYAYKSYVTFVPEERPAARAPLRRATGA